MQRPVSFAITVLIAVLAVVEAAPCPNPAFSPHGVSLVTVGVHVEYDGCNAPNVDLQISSCSGSSLSIRNSKFQRVIVQDAQNRCSIEIIGTEIDSILYGGSGTVVSFSHSLLHIENVHILTQPENAGASIGARLQDVLVTNCSFTFSGVFFNSTGATSTRRSASLVLSKSAFISSNITVRDSNSSVNCKHYSTGINDDSATFTIHRAELQDSRVEVDGLTSKMLCSDHSKTNFAVWSGMRLVRSHVSFTDVNTTDPEDPEHRTTIIVSDGGANYVEKAEDSTLEFKRFLNRGKSLIQLNSATLDMKNTSISFDEVTHSGLTGSLLQIGKVRLFESMNISVSDSKATITQNSDKNTGMLIVQGIYSTKGLRDTAITVRNTTVEGSQTVREGGLLVFDNPDRGFVAERISMDVSNVTVFLTSGSSNTRGTCMGAVSFLSDDNIINSLKNSTIRIADADITVYVFTASGSIKRSALVCARNFHLDDTIIEVNDTKLTTSGGNDGTTVISLQSTLVQGASAIKADVHGQQAGSGGSLIVLSRSVVEGTTELQVSSGDSLLSYSSHLGGLSGLMLELGSRIQENASVVIGGSHRPQRFKFSAATDAMLINQCSNCSIGEGTRVTVEGGSFSMRAADSLSSTAKAMSFDIGSSVGGCAKNATLDPAKLRATEYMKALTAWDDKLPFGKPALVGSSIWFPPYEYNRIGKFDVVSNTYVEFPLDDAPAPSALNFLYIGACSDSAGYVWFAPAIIVNQILRVDTRDGSQLGIGNLTFFVRDDEASAKNPPFLFANCAFDKDTSSVWMPAGETADHYRIDTVTNTVRRIEVPSAVNLTNGGVNYDAIAFSESYAWIGGYRATQFLRYNKFDFSPLVIDPPTGMGTSNSNPLFHAAFVIHDVVWFIPQSALLFVKITISTSVAEGINGAGGDGYRDAVMVGDLIWCVPFLGSQLLVLDPSSGDMVQHPFPQEVTLPTYQYQGVVYFENSLWLNPWKMDADVPSFIRLHNTEACSGSFTFQNMSLDLTNGAEQAFSSVSIDNISYVPGNVTVKDVKYQSTPGSNTFVSRGFHLEAGTSDSASYGFTSAAIQIHVEDSHFNMTANGATSNFVSVRHVEYSELDVSLLNSTVLMAQAAGSGSAVFAIGSLTSSDSSKASNATQITMQNTRVELEEWKTAAKFWADNKELSGLDFRVTHSEVLMSCPGFASEGFIISNPITNGISLTFEDSLWNVTDASGSQFFYTDTTATNLTMRIFSSNVVLIGTATVETFFMMWEDAVINSTFMFEDSSIFMVCDKSGVSRCDGFLLEAVSNSTLSMVNSTLSLASDRTSASAATIIAIDFTRQHENFRVLFENSLISVSVVRSLDNIQAFLLRSTMKGNSSVVFKGSTIVVNATGSTTGSHAIALRVKTNLIADATMVSAESPVHRALLLDGCTVEAFGSRAATGLSVSSARLERSGIEVGSSTVSVGAEGDGQYANGFTVESTALVSGRIDVLHCHLWVNQTESPSGVLVQISRVTASESSVINVTGSTFNFRESHDGLRLREDGIPSSFAFYTQLSNFSSSSLALENVVFQGTDNANYNNSRNDVYLYKTWLTNSSSMALRNVSFRSKVRGGSSFKFSYSSASDATISLTDIELHLDRSEIPVDQSSGFYMIDLFWSNMSDSRFVLDRTRVSAESVGTEGAFALVRMFADSPISTYFNVTLNFSSAEVHASSGTRAIQVKGHAFSNGGGLAFNNMSWRGNVLEGTLFIFENNRYEGGTTALVVRDLDVDVDDSTSTAFVYWKNCNAIADGLEQDPLPSLIEFDNVRWRSSTKTAQYFIYLLNSEISSRVISMRGFDVVLNGTTFAFFTVWSGMEFKQSRLLVDNITATYSNFGSGIKPLRWLEVSVEDTAVTFSNIDFVMGSPSSIIPLVLATHNSTARNSHLALENVWFNATRKPTVVELQLSNFTDSDVTISNITGQAEMLYMLRFSQAIMSNVTTIIDGVEGFSMNEVAPILIQDSSFSNHRLHVRDSNLRGYTSLLQQGAATPAQAACTIDVYCTFVGDALVNKASLLPVPSLYSTAADVNVYKTKHSDGSLCMTSTLSLTQSHSAAGSSSHTQSLPQSASAQQTPSIRSSTTESIPVDSEGSRTATLLVGERSLTVTPNQRRPVTPTPEAVVLPPTRTVTSTVLIAPDPTTLEPTPAPGTPATPAPDLCKLPAISASPPTMDLGDFRRSRRVVLQLVLGSNSAINSTSIENVSWPLSSTQSPEDYGFLEFARNTSLDNGTTLVAVGGDLVRLASTRVVSPHHMIVTLMTDAAEDDLPLSEEVNIDISLNLSPELFSCPANQSWDGTRDVTGHFMNGLVRFTFTPSAAGVPKDVKTSIQTTSVAATTVSAVLSNPTTAMQQSRVSALVNLASCEFSHNEEMSVTDSPMGWRVGKEVGYWYRGALVGNAVVLIIILMISMAVVFVLAAPGGKRKHWLPIREAFARVHIPGVWTVPILVLLQGTVTASTALLLHGLGQFDTAMAICCFLVVLAIIGSVIFVCTVGFKAKAVPRDLSGMTQAGGQNNGCERLMLLVFLSKVKWIDDPDVPNSNGFKNHFQEIFYDFREGYQGYIAAEMFMTILVGVLDGIKSTDHCRGVAIVLLLILLIQAAISVFIRPFVSLFETFFHIAISVLTAFSAVLVVGSVYSPDTNMDDTAQIVGLTVELFASVKVIFDIGFLLRWFVSRYTAMQRKRAERRRQAAKLREANTKFAANGDSDSLLDLPLMGSSSHHEDCEDNAALLPNEDEALDDDDEPWLVRTVAKFMDWFKGNKKGDAFDGDCSHTTDSSSGSGNSGGPAKTYSLDVDIIGASEAHNVLDPHDAREGEYDDVELLPVDDAGSPSAENILDGIDFDELDDEGPNHDDLGAETSSVQDPEALDELLAPTGLAMTEATAAELQENDQRLALKDELDQLLGISTASSGGALYMDGTASQSVMEGVL